MSAEDGHLTWMTFDDIAEYLRLSSSRRYDLAQSEEIPCSKIAGGWRFHRSEVEEWMLRQRPAPKRIENNGHNQLRGTC